jgi:uncharacterized protein YchJ
MPSNNKKIGRNDPCPCGSGKKYKFCCYDKDRKTILKYTHPIPRDIIRKLHIHKVNQQRRKERFGEVKDIIHADFQGHKFVAVGNQLMYSKKWKTFPDFLISYIGSVFGSPWGNSELNKPYNERHQIAKLYSHACTFMSTAGDTAQNGIRSVEPDGCTAAYLRLAYDLYILRQHATLQERIVERLKSKEQYQGVRHELFVASTFIRAGFKIEFEDEADKSKKHAEFTAYHKEYDEYMAVEAKSRHRPGVLDYLGQFENSSVLKLGVRRLMNKAFSKNPEYPFAVFIDINIPPIPGRIQDKPWFQELWDNVYEDGGPSDENPDLFNIMVFSNSPEHYVEPGEICPPSEFISVISKRPRTAMRNPQLLFEIDKAVNQYGNIPNHFPKNWDCGEIEPL